MGHQVKNAHGERAHAAGHEHVTELRDRRIGEYAFDVGLQNAHSRGENTGSPALSSQCSKRILRREIELSARVGSETPGIRPGCARNCATGDIGEELIENDSSS